MTCELKSDAQPIKPTAIHTDAFSESLSWRCRNCDPSNYGEPSTQWHSIKSRRTDLSTMPLQKSH